MAVGEIIACVNAQDLYRKAEDLQKKGIQTVFASRNTLKVVNIKQK